MDFGAVLGSAAGGTAAVLGAAGAALSLAGRTGTGSSGGDRPSLFRLEGCELGAASEKRSGFGGGCVRLGVVPSAEGAGVTARTLGGAVVSGAWALSGGGGALLGAGVPAAPV